MASLISEDYREQCRLLHQQKPGWGSKGFKNVESLLELCDKYRTKDVLDYGCGKGLLAKRLQFPIKEYDPGIPEKRKLPEPADIVICRDVLEHVEIEKLEDVLEHLAGLVLLVGRFEIACQAAKDWCPDGTNAHKIIESRQWWIERLHPWFGRIVELDGKKSRLVVLVESRRD